MHHGCCSFSLETLRPVRKDTECFFMAISFKFVYFIRPKVNNFFLTVRDYNCKRLSVSVCLKWHDEKTFNTGAIWKL